MLLTNIRVDKPHAKLYPGCCFSELTWVLIQRRNILTLFFFLFYRMEEQQRGRVEVSTRPVCTCVCVCVWKKKKERNRKREGAEAIFSLFNPSMQPIHQGNYFLLSRIHQRAWNLQSYRLTRKAQVRHARCAVCLWITCPAAHVGWWAGCVLGRRVIEVEVTKRRAGEGKRWPEVWKWCKTGRN